MVIAWLRSCDLFPIFARANELISRDEWLHVKLGVAYFHYLFNRNKLDQMGLTTDDIVGIIQEAVDLECKFATTLVPASTSADRLEGLKPEELVNHIQHLGNEIAEMFRLGRKPWKDADPSKQPHWYGHIGMQPKASFYETAVTSYTIPTEASANPKDDEDI